MSPRKAQCYIRSREAALDHLYSLRDDSVHTRYLIEASQQIKRLVHSGEDARITWEASERRRRLHNEPSTEIAKGPVFARATIDGPRWMRSLGEWGIDWPAMSGRPLHGSPPWDCAADWVEEFPPGNVLDYRVAYILRRTPRALEVMMPAYVCCVADICGMRRPSPTQWVLLELNAGLSKNCTHDNCFAEYGRRRERWEKRAKSKSVLHQIDELMAPAPPGPLRQPKNDHER